MNESISHGKIILMGEHAVVYGYGAIALPLFSHTVSAKVEKSEEDILVSSIYHGKIILAPTHLNHVCEVISETKRRLMIEEPLKITIDSTIPPSRGMGSSAAVVSSIIKALFHFKKIHLPQEQLLELVHIGETLAHGNPSGLDGVIVNSKFPVVFKRGKGISPIQSRMSGYLVIMDTGISASTKQAVMDVAQLIKKDEAFRNTLDQLGKLSESSVSLIEKGNMKKLGKNMILAQQLLKHLTVSHPIIDVCVDQAIAAGALGAKLTGGGRGGCVIALCADETSRDAVLARWNSKECWVLDLNVQKVKARAHANIALVKYWGKEDEDRVIPFNSSLSLTLDKLYTDTTIETSAKDEFILNGQIQDEQESRKLFRFIDRFRELSIRKNPVRITSVNNFPTAAGLASSASGYAACATAANRYFNLNMAKIELSEITRFGSGSATRSLFGGFAIWKKDATPYAYEFDRADWDIAMIIVIISQKQKKISSREAMRITVLTSPYFPAWVENAQIDLNHMMLAIKKQDFREVGEITRNNALRMHASMMAANPPIIYLQPQTLSVLKLIDDLNQEGFDCYPTMDAGPNVKILTRRSQANTIIQRLSDLIDQENLIMCLPSEGSVILDES